MSRPARGAWVEILAQGIYHGIHKSRPARGAWVEITKDKGQAIWITCRAPHGARGLK